MNVNDTEIVWSILKSNGYTKVNQAREADVILIMTCAIRENAEGKVWQRLNHYRAMKQTNKKARRFPLKIGILGERRFQVKGPAVCPRGQHSVFL